MTAGCVKKQLSLFHHTHMGEYKCLYGGDYEQGIIHIEGINFSASAIDPCQTLNTQLVVKATTLDNPSILRCTRVPSDITGTPYSMESHFSQFLNKEFPTIKSILFFHERIAH